MKKNINPQAIEIQKRFFRALDLAIQANVITGIQGFCKEHNLNRVKYQRIKTSLQKPDAEQLYKIIDLDALMYICKDFNISAEWLLLGKGQMFNREYSCI